MTDHTTDCPNCAHPHHLPGTECQTPVNHGPSSWHICLCLARPGAALSCPPQMTCQGGTLGYSDIWYLQHGHTLVGDDGEISAEVLRVEPRGPRVSADGVAEAHRLALSTVLGLGTSAPWDAIQERAAELAAGQPAVDRTALTKRTAEARDRLRGMALSLATGAGPLVEPPAFTAALDEYADAIAAALPAPADRAAVLREAADRLWALANRTTERGAGVLWAADWLRRLAGEVQQDEAQADPCSGCRYVPCGNCQPGKEA